jgi:hypothetical protein
MQRAAAEAARTIAVLSPDYLASRFTQPEWAAAFAQDPTGEKGTLLPVRVQECDLKGLLPQIVYVDLVGLEEAAAKESLLAGVLRGRAKPTAPPGFPGAGQRSVAERPRFPEVRPGAGERAQREAEYLQAVREAFARWGQGFIDLELFANEPREEAAARLRELLDSGLLEQPLFEIAQARGLGETPQRVRLKGVLELLDKDYDAVILGEPGCGKTTTLQRLALESAERVQRGQEKARIPVFLRLAAWDGGPLEEFVTQSVGDPLAPGLPGLLETGRLLLLFDALNEMPRADEGDYRRRVQAWREFRAGHSDNRFLVTCRRLDYTETLPLQQVEIEPFDAGRVEAFLRRFPDGDRLLAALAERGYALEEWGNPLLLKVLYLVVRTGQFPDNRGQLFQQFVEYRLAVEESKHPADWIDAKAQQSALSQLAFAMTDRDGKMSTEVENEWAVEQLPNRVPAGIGKSVALDGPGREHLLKLTADANLIELTEKLFGPVTLRFWHHLLQEYFAARELARRCHARADLTRCWGKLWREEELPRVRGAGRDPGEFEPLPPPPATGWEEAAIVAAGLEKDASPLVQELVAVNPVLAGRCVVEGRAPVSDEVLAVVVQSLVKTMRGSPPLAKGGPGGGPASAHRRRARGRGVGGLAGFPAPPTAGA